MNSEISKILVSAGQFAFQDKPSPRLSNEGVDLSNIRETENVVMLEKQTQSPVDSAEKLKESVNQLNNLVTSVQRDIRFTLDEFSGKTVITVSDSQTDKVIRQIPSEEVLALAKNMDSLKGVLFSAEI